MAHPTGSIPRTRIPLPATHPPIGATTTLSSSALRTSHYDGLNPALQTWAEIPSHGHPARKIGLEAALIVVAITARFALQFIQDVTLLDEQIERAVLGADLVIGAVLVPGAKAPKLVTREMISKMQPGGVVVDVAVDQGGSVETCRPTSHEHPTYTVDGVIHYAVPNMPGAVPRTSTYALTNVTLKYASMIANLGWKEAVSRDEALRKGVNILNGKVAYKQVADDLGLPFEPVRI